MILSITCLFINGSNILMRTNSCDLWVNIQIYKFTIYLQHRNKTTFIADVTICLVTAVVNLPPQSKYCSDRKFYC